MKKIISLSLLFSVFILSVFSQSRAVFYTSQGNFSLYLEDTLAPITAGNFISLVNQKYYDGVLFHRVIKNFMIQGGNGAAKPNIQDEFILGLSNVKGTISMANTGAPNSGNTQFFINLVNNTYLDFNKSPLTSKHPVFGHVELGFNMVERIGGVATSGSPLNKPLTNVVIDSIRMISTAPVAKNLEVQNVFFTNPLDPPSSPVNSQEIVTGRTLKLWFNFKNNLALSQNLMIGDSLTFGWSIDGVNQGLLTMPSLSATVDNGNSIAAFLKSDYTVLNNVGETFEICSWPLYNPYNPNADPFVGRNCQSFKTIDIPATIYALNKSINKVYVVDRVVHFELENKKGNCSVKVFNSTGTLVQSAVVNGSSKMRLNSDLSSGIYLIRISLNEQNLAQKFYLE